MCYCNMNPKHISVILISIIFLSCKGNIENSDGKEEEQEINLDGGWTSLASTKTLNGKTESYFEDVQLQFYSDYVLNMTYPCQAIRLSFDTNGDTLFYPELDRTDIFGISGDTLYLTTTNKRDSSVHQMKLLRTEFLDSTLKKLESESGINFDCIKGKWKLKEEDLFATKLTYVGNLPTEFTLDSIQQLKEFDFTVNTVNGPYSLWLVEYFPDSSVLSLHPSICKCEGLELHYEKQHITQ